MIVNFNGTNFEIPDQRRIDAVHRALLTDERTADVFNNDPLSWISLLEAVGNYLQDPAPFYLNQLVGHFESLIDDIADEYLDDENDDPGEDL